MSVYTTDAKNDCGIATETETDAPEPIAAVVADVTGFIVDFGAYGTAAWAAEDTVRRVAAAEGI